MIRLASALSTSRAYHASTKAPRGSLHSLELRRRRLRRLAPTLVTINPISNRPESGRGVGIEVAGFDADSAQDEQHADDRRERYPDQDAARVGSRRAHDADDRGK